MDRFNDGSTPIDALPVHEYHGSEPATNSGLTDRPEPVEPASLRRSAAGPTKPRQLSGWSLNDPYLEPLIAVLFIDFQLFAFLVLTWYLT